MKREVSVPKNRRKVLVISRHSEMGGMQCRLFSCQLALLSCLAKGGSE